jgi:hypothetical protein
VLARYSASLIPPSNRYHSVLPASDPLGALGAWASNWFRFDARWYVDVAMHGYHYSTPAASNTNFFPLYPILIRVVEPVTLGSPWIASWLISNLAFLAAVLLVWTWAQERWGKQVALPTVLLLCVFPFAFFYVAPYAESLFLALAAGAFLLADRDRWGWAAVLAGLSAVTRPTGIAVIGGLLVIALLRRQGRAAAFSAAALLPFLLFVGYLGLTVGDPLAFTVYHTAGWLPPHGGLTGTVTEQFHTKLSPFDRVDAAAVLVFLASAVPVWRRIGPGYAVFVVLGVVLPLVRSLAGLERYVIVLFPVFAVWAQWKNGLVRVAIFALSLLLLLIGTALFAGGYAVF